MVEWGFGATLTSIVKPVMHALNYGYCLDTPPAMLKYNCSDFSTLFQPIGTPMASQCGSACDGIGDKIVLRDDTMACGPTYSKTVVYNEMGFPLNFEETDMRACNEKYSDTLQGSDALPGVLGQMLSSQMGFFPLVSFIQARALRPSDYMQTRINAAKKAIGWPAAGTKVLSVHHRAGDACLENSDTLGRKCEPFSVTMEKANILAGKYGIKHIFLATDSNAVIDGLSNYTNYTFLYNHVSRGGVKDHVELDKALKQGLIDGCSEGMDSLLDIQLLAAGDALIGKFSSNIARVAYSLMFARQSAYPPFISLDNYWCFDFGVKSRPGAPETGAANNQMFYC